MQETAPRLANSAISLQQLRQLADGWLLAGDIDQHSARTLGSRRDIVDKLLWFLRSKDHDCCGVNELRGYFHYLNHGHKEPGGRWGNPQMTKPVTPRTVHTYHGHLRTFFRWIVAEGVTDVSPMDRIPVPTTRDNEVQPYSIEQVQALIASSKRSDHPKRDEAILRLLFDTGIRASELCGTKRKDVDFLARSCTVLGKGRKSRAVFYGKDTARALYNLIKERPLEDDEFMFRGDRGTRTTEPLTRSGLGQLTERLGKAARITGTKCGIHRCRHFYALQFLRNGGNQFSLMSILGHTSLTMTNRYVQLSQADISTQGRTFSPMDRIKSSAR